MIVETATVRNRLGLHARAASRLVQVAQEYAAEIHIKNGKQTANGKSIMAILMLQATVGTELTLSAEGEDEAEAIKAIVDLIDNRFSEPE